jgi:hypothetical protein
MASAPVYGCAMRESIAKGDLDDMKALAEQAEQHIREHGNVPLVLEVLKTEIAKAQRSERSGPA